MKINSLNTGLIIIILCSLSACNRVANKELIIFHAGSLSVPMKEAIKEFNGMHPDVKIFTEAAGSRSCARKITDLNRECDIMASADYTVIDQLLIPKYSNWNIKFASNEMVIAFNEKSRYSDKFNLNNWYHILLKEDVSYGRSDPNSDPCGYRSVLITKLAEKNYQIEDLSLKLLPKNQKYIRPKETDLLALLETSVLDYIFIYRSVAEQHGLKYILLPDEINLKKTELAEVYKSATVEISGKKPGDYITKKGEPIVYGICILKDAPNKEIAIKFLEFFLSEKGKQIMEKNGQPSLIPSKTKYFNYIPENLKKFVRPI